LVFATGGEFAQRPRLLPLFLGQGGGAFVFKNNVTAERGPERVVAGDVNSDGRLDLVVSNSDATMTILLGNGDGTFTQSSVLQSPQHSTVAIGDLNNDTRPDLAVVNTYGFVDSPGLWVFLGGGDGTFGSPAKYRAGVGSNSVAIGDVNGDASADIAVANSNSNTVSVFLGNGDGTFQVKMDYGTGFYPRSVRLADINEDRRLDIVVANGVSSSISVLLNRGPTPVAVEDLEALALDGRGRLEWRRASQASAAPRGVAVAL